jgi:hypothetical protein
MGRHDKTLAEIFERPTRKDVRWTAFVGLLRHRGGDAKPGAGSRFRCEINGARAVIHRPHPGDVMNEGQVEAARALLQAGGVTP